MNNWGNTTNVLINTALPKMVRWWCSKTSKKFTLFWTSISYLSLPQKFHHQNKYLNILFFVSVTKLLSLHHQCHLCPEKFYQDISRHQGNSVEQFNENILNEQLLTKIGAYFSGFTDTHILLSTRHSERQELNSRHFCHVWCFSTFFVIRKNKLTFSLWSSFILLLTVAEMTTA